MANFDRNSIVRQTFWPYVIARWIRIHPVTCFGYCSMRMELTGCQNGLQGIFLKTTEDIDETKFSSRKLLNVRRDKNFGSKLLNLRRDKNFVSKTPKSETRRKEKIP